MDMERYGFSIRAAGVAWDECAFDEVGYLDHVQSLDNAWCGYEVYQILDDAPDVSTNVIFQTDDEDELRCKCAQIAEFYEDAGHFKELTSLDEQIIEGHYVTLGLCRMTDSARLVGVKEGGLGLSHNDKKMLFSLLRDKYENAASFASIPKQAYRRAWADEAAHIQSLYEKLSFALCWPGQDKDAGFGRLCGRHFKDSSLTERGGAAHALADVQNNVKPDRTVSAILQHQK
jgi:hypothetical protein